MYEMLLDDLLDKLEKNGIDISKIKISEVSLVRYYIYLMRSNSSKVLYTLLYFRHNSPKKRIRSTIS